jgi:hypothetical protein
LYAFGDGGDPQIMPRFDGAGKASCVLGASAAQEGRGYACTARLSAEDAGCRLVDAVRALGSPRRRARASRWAGVFGLILTEKGMGQADGDI